MTGAFLLVVSTGLVFLAAVYGARLAGTAPGVERVLAVGTLAAVEIILCSLAAGLVNAYTPTGLTVVVALVAGMLALVHRRRFGWLVRRSTPTWPSLRLWQAALVALAALALAWRVVLAAVLPPFAFDTYHMTAVATWVESSKVEANRFSFCCAQYPSNGELLHGWLSVFTHVDTLADASQIGTALLGTAAVAALARWAGVSSGGAIAAAALFLATPIVLTQANTPYVDVTFVAFVLAAVAMLVRFLDATPFRLGGRGVESPPRFALLVLAGLAAGAALGAKHFALPAVAVLAILLAAHVVVARARGRTGTGLALAIVAVFAACCVLVGGSWYARSWVATGNPVWPATVRVGSTHVFEGRRRLDDLLTVPPGGRKAWWYEVARSWYHDLAFWTRRDYSYEERDGGLGPVWSWFGWAAVAGLAWWGIRRRPAVVVNLIAPFALLFAVQPYRWWSRFTIYLPALAAIGIAVAVDRLGRRGAATALAGATVVLASAGVVLASWHVDPAGRGRVIDARDVVGLIGTPGHERTAGALFFSEYAWLGRVPPNAPIAVEEFASSIRFVYPFVAPRFERRIDLLTGRPGGMLAGRLARDRIGFVAVERGGAYDRWARGYPDVLVPFWSGDGVQVYRARSTAYPLRPA